MRGFLVGFTVVVDSSSQTAFFVKRIYVYSASQKSKYCNSRSFWKISETPDINGGGSTTQIGPRLRATINMPTRNTLFYTSKKFSYSGNTTSL